MSTIRRYTSRSCGGVSVASVLMARPRFFYSTPGALPQAPSASAGTTRHKPQVPARGRPVPSLALRACVGVPRAGAGEVAHELLDDGLKRQPPGDQHVRWQPRADDLVRVRVVPLFVTGPAQRPEVRLLQGAADVDLADTEGDGRAQAFPLHRGRPVQ